MSAIYNVLQKFAELSLVSAKALKKSGNVLEPCLNRIFKAQRLFVHV